MPARTTAGSASAGTSAAAPRAGAAVQPGAERTRNAADAAANARKNRVVVIFFSMKKGRRPEPPPLCYAEGLGRSFLLSGPACSWERYGCFRAP